MLDDFYDREFNPLGARPVITFCDGGDAASDRMVVSDDRTGLVFEVAIY